MIGKLLLVIVIVGLLLEVMRYLLLKLLVIGLVIKLLMLLKLVKLKVRMVFGVVVLVRMSENLLYLMNLVALILINVLIRHEVHYFLLVINRWIRIQMQRVRSTVPEGPVLGSLGSTGR